MLRHARAQPSPPHPTAAPRTCPGKPAAMMAATLGLPCAHDRSTGPPFITTSAMGVAGLRRASALTRSSWRPGRPRPSRSKPSPSETGRYERRLSFWAGVRGVLMMEAPRNTSAASAPSQDWGRCLCG
jgi:hypothetical protein